MMQLFLSSNEDSKISWITVVTDSSTQEANGMEMEVQIVLVVENIIELAGNYFKMIKFGGREIIRRFLRVSSRDETNSPTIFQQHDFCYLLVKEVFVRRVSSYGH